MLALGNIMIVKITNIILVILIILASHHPHHDHRTHHIGWLVTRCRQQPANIYSPCGLLLGWASHCHQYPQYPHRYPQYRHKYYQHCHQNPRDKILNISTNQDQSKSLVLSDIEFVKKFTPPDFQAKNFTPSISHNFNSFSKKKHKKWVKQENFTLLANSTSVWERDPSLTPSSQAIPPHRAIPSKWSDGKRSRGSDVQEIDLVQQSTLNISTSYLEHCNLLHWTSNLIIGVFESLNSILDDCLIFMTISDAWFAVKRYHSNTSNKHCKKLWTENEKPCLQPSG